MKKNRPYTGTSDVKVNKQRSRPGTKTLIDLICYFFQMRPLGTLTSNLTSVHYTGRAFDVGPIIPAGGDFRYLNINLLRFLSKYADELGIEEIHDYSGIYVPGTKTSVIPRYVRPATDPPEIYTERNMFGAGYRCNRQASTLPVEGSENYYGWKIWDARAHKAHGGKSIGSTHIHVEVNPKMSELPIDMSNSFLKGYKNFIKIDSGWVSLK